MGERTFEMKPHGIEYMCDACIDIAVVYKTMDLLSNPAVSIHICPNCSRTYNLAKSYPTVGWTRL